MNNDDYVKNKPYTLAQNILSIEDKHIAVNFIKETKVSFNPTNKAKVYFGVLLGLGFIVLSDIDKMFKSLVVVGLFIFIISIYHLILNRYALFFLFRGQ